LKINIFLTVIFLSFTFLAYSNLLQNSPQRIGGTELNGLGCVCHSSDEDNSVNVWVEGPETLIVGKTGYYKMFLAGGPAEAGGYNVAGRFGTMGAIDTLTVWDYRAPNELTQAFPLLFSDPKDTIFWPFEYTASDSSNVDTIYSAGLSIKYDSIPDINDRWAFGPKFPLIIINKVTSTESDIKGIITGFELKQNYPNPFNPSTVISWQMAVEGYVQLKVYDILGNEVAALIDKELPAGKYKTEFNSSGLSSGLYFYKLHTGKFSDTKKMLLLK
jgi:hypothetical protein